MRVVEGLEGRLRVLFCGELHKGKAPEGPIKLLGEPQALDLRRAQRPTEQGESIKLQALQPANAGQEKHGTAFKKQTS